jgi:hypothetical protein
MQSGPSERVKMPFTYTVDPNLRLVLTKGTGTISDEESQQLSAMQRQDPRIHPTMRELLDLRQVDRLSITPSWLRTRAETDKKYAHEYANTLAIVVGSEVAFGFARMYELLTDDHFQVRVFRDYAEACEWLGISG